MVKLRKSGLQVSLVVLTLSLSACNDQTTQTTQLRQTQTLAQTLEEEDRHAALYDQADSLWYLENERAKRLASGETAPEGLIQNLPQTKRGVGDYSFTQPPIPPVSKAGQLLNLPDPGRSLVLPSPDCNGLRMWGILVSPCGRKIKPPPLA